MPLNAQIREEKSAAVLELRTDNSDSASSIVPKHERSMGSTNAATLQLQQMTSMLQRLQQASHRNAAALQSAQEDPLLLSHPAAPKSRSSRQTLGCQIQARLPRRQLQFPWRRGSGRRSDGQDPSRLLPLARGRAERPCKARRSLSRLPLPGHKRLHSRLEAPDLPQGRLLLATSCRAWLIGRNPSACHPRGCCPEWAAHVKSPAGSHTAQLCTSTRGRGRLRGVP